jgi:hypothetical protein
MTVQLLRARSASLVVVLAVSLAASSASAQTLTPAEEDAQKRFV